MGVWALGGTQPHLAQCQAKLAHVLLEAGTDTLSISPGEETDPKKLNSPRARDGVRAGAATWKLVTTIQTSPSDVEEALDS